MHIFSCIDTTYQINLQKKLWNLIIKNLLDLKPLTILSYPIKLLLKEEFHLGKGKKVESSNRKALEEAVEEGSQL